MSKKKDWLDSLFEGINALSDGAADLAERASEIVEQHLAKMNPEERKEKRQAFHEAVNNATKTPVTYKHRIESCRGEIVITGSFKKLTINGTEVKL